jgi:ABC-type nitrate/sulfonate/bicarbonate transport system substrate-binding protein
MKRTEIKFIALIWLLGFLLTSHGQVAHAVGKVPLRVGYLPLLPQVPLVVSYENDHLNLDNIELELVKYNSFTSLEAALRVEAIDIASLPVPIVLSMVTDGHKIKIIGTCHSGGSQLMATAQGSLETVRGNLIGVPGLDSNENLRLSQVCGAMNLRHGLDYKPIGVPFNTVINDLKAKKLDAIYLPEPFGTIAEKEQIAVAIKGQQGKLTGAMGTVLVIRSKILKENKTGVEEWLRSLIKSCRFIEKDVEEFRARQTTIIQSSYFQYPESIVATSLVERKGDLRFDRFTPSIEDIKKHMDLALQMKIITKSVDLDTLVSLELIKQVSE